MALKKMIFNINGADRICVVDYEKDTLADFLRRLGYTSVKLGCKAGICGACSVIVDGKVVRACTRKISKVPEYAQIQTLEGLGTAKDLHPLQMAWLNYGGVQCGFCTPGFIMSAKALLDENPSPTREEVRAWFTKNHNLCRCTGYKPLVDATMAAAEVMRGERTFESLDMTALEPGQSMLGGRYPKPTGLAKVLGVADYGDDIQLKMPPETLHLAMVMPPVSHAIIKGIDISEAEKMPGVYKVVTAKDIKGTNCTAFPLGHPRCQATGMDHPILCDKKVFMRGDVLAVVAARTEEEAHEAAKYVKLDLEELPAYMSYLEAAQPGAMRIHEEAENIFCWTPLFKGEDVRDVMDEAPHVVEGSFHTSREPHLPIEPDVVQAYWDADGCLAVQCKSQFPHGTQMQIAAGIGLPTEKVRIIQNPTGASFGYSMSATNAAIAAACAIATDHPVTLTMSYKEFMLFTGKRSPAYCNARMSADENGLISGLEFDIAFDHGAYSEESMGPMTRVLTFLGFPYKIPNIRALSRMGYSNHNFGTAYRGFGSPQGYTISETLVDMLAEDCGMDPFEFRYKNIAREGDLNNNSYSFKLYPMEEMMDILRPYYEEACKRRDAETTPEKARGVGVICGGYVSSGNADRAQVALELNEDGTFTTYNGWSDQGQGADLGALITTHEALRPLNVPPENIRLVMDDTLICPMTGPAAGSRSYYMAGKAVKNAADQLIDAMRKEDGTYRTYQEMVDEGIPTKYIGTATNTGDKSGIDPNTGHGDGAKEYMYLTGIGEVEVDTATGKTKVLGITLVADVGNLGSEILVEGQAYGGISHTIGYALSEEYEDVDKQLNLKACGIPTCEEVPDNMKVIYHITPREDGPYGASGCSECFQNAGHMVVLNGIHDAVGVRIMDLPAKPEKVKAAMEAKARGEDTTPAPYYLGPDMYDELEEIEKNPLVGKIEFKG